MPEYIFKNKSAWRTWGLRLILTPQSCLKNLEFASAWKVSTLVLHACSKNCLHLRQFVAPMDLCPNIVWFMYLFELNKPFLKLKQVSSGMIVALICRPHVLSDSFVCRNILYYLLFGYLRFFFVTTVLRVIFKRAFIFCLSTVLNLSSYQNIHEWHFIWRFLIFVA
jgi:hypothetical protein